MNSVGIHVYLENIHTYMYEVLNLSESSGKDTGGVGREREM